MSRIWSRDSSDAISSDACQKHNKGLFVVLKTSNPGSKDFEDQPLEATGRPLYEKIAGVLNELGEGLVGESGYSSIGAVIGATFPEEGSRLRSLMPKAPILVPGYGAQVQKREGRGRML